MEAKNRCGWVSADPLYQQYHDEEWGVPLYDEQRMFEFIVLESFQAGLSWYTILKKRENFRKAFAGFDPAKVADFDDSRVEELMQDIGIIRNRQKIVAAINNAQRFLELQREYGSFCKFIWSYVSGKPIDGKIKDYKQAPAKTEISDKLAKDLRKFGFKFLGSTTVYAHMQASGMVNDHTHDCFRYEEVKKLV